MNKHYAGFWVRFFAGFLDLLFITPFILLLIYFTGSSTYQFVSISNSIENFSQARIASSNSVADIVTYLVSIIYIAYFLSGKKQATIGKILMGIYVARSDGSKLTTLRATARALASLLTAATLGLGFIAVIFTKEKISLHDFLCDTRVFHGKKK